MAATRLDITELPLSTLLGFQHKLRVTALNADGSVDTGYAGTVNFTSSDTAIVIVSAALVAGTRVFPLRMGSVGAHTVVATATALTSGTAHTQVDVQPPDWGLDDKGLLPYGDAASGVGAALRKAQAVTTRQVDVWVTGLVQDNSPFLAGDALNPATWGVQRLDTNEFLHVVSVEQVGVYTYRVLCLEEFGAVTVTHRINSTTLKDVTGQVINTPRNVDFVGLLDEDKTSLQSTLAAHSSSVRDLANPQVPSQEWFAGTLQLNAAGDYQLESGAALVKKLILRRLMSTPGDFFHLSDYGIGLRLKEAIPASRLGNLKTQIEAQCLREPEVQSVAAIITLASNGVLTVLVRATLRKTGESLEIGFKSNNQGLALTG